MSRDGLKQARELTIQGFHYENLVEMARHCREEERPDCLLCAYVMERFFTHLAQEVGDGPVFSDVLRKLEVRYRNTVNLALEKADAGAPREEQDELLTRLVRLLWTASQD
jgi:hypothetical protein